MPYFTSSGFALLPYFTSSGIVAKNSVAKNFAKHKRWCPKTAF
jgi:hypothetical protein